MTEQPSCELRTPKQEREPQLSFRIASQLNLSNTLSKTGLASSPTPQAKELAVDLTEAPLLVPIEAAT